MTVSGWWHRRAALVGQLATSAKPYKRKMKNDGSEEKKEHRCACDCACACIERARVIVGRGCGQVQKTSNTNCLILFI